ncbi:MAG: DUF2156 domain-containing protein [Candidatus Bathyarchaeota archaeon]|nr:DUF2156 domain-containing protein [Candidatus Bathyarchaeota archaeon]
MVEARYSLALFRRLTKNMLIQYQHFGRFDEHLAGFYSLAYGNPYIYKDTYLVYYDKYSRILYLSLFELHESENKLKCIRTAMKLFKPEKLIVTSPQELPLNIGEFHCAKGDYDKDYQIYVPDFDETLKGRKLKQLRYRVHNAEKRGYRLEIGKKMTPAHFHIIAQHEQLKRLDLYDSQLYLSIWEYLQKFKSPLLFNVFSNGTFIGFDLVDFFQDTMTIPLGFYTDAPSLADFIVFKEILYAKQREYTWLDLGWACDSGIEEFKKKWTAIPRFQIWAYEYMKDNNSDEARFRKETAIVCHGN